MAVVFTRNANMKMLEAAMARDKYLAKSGWINALTMSLLQGMLLCHTLVKSCSGAVQIAGLSIWYQSLNQLTLSRFGCRLGGRAQILCKSWGVEPICCFSLQADTNSEYWNRRKDQPFSPVSPKNEKQVNILLERAASTREKETNLTGKVTKEEIYPQARVRKIDGK